MKGRLEACMFREDEDYVVFDSPNLANQTGRGGDRRSKSYFLSLDVAKHFAMLERNEKGFEVRQYFVEFEKQAKKLGLAPRMDPEQIGKMAVASIQEAGTFFNFRLPLDGEFKVGANWAETH